MEVTLLNGMASPDFETALDCHLAWGLRLLDLKDCIFGKDLLSLTDEEASCAAALIRDRSLEVYCLSSSLFHADVENGRGSFTEGLRARVDRLIELAHVLQPQVTRLLGAITSRRDEVEDAIADVERRHPWLIEEYQWAIDRVAANGFTTTIENEVRGCILSCPEEVRRLFRLIDRPGRVMFTWDVQNMWQAGTWPGIEVCDSLTDLTGYLHLKGGKSTEPGGPLLYRCRLEDSSYDVKGIVERVAAEGRVSVICLNPPHGDPRPGCDETGRVEHDIKYVQKLITETTRAEPRPKSRV